MQTLCAFLTIIFSTQLVAAQDKPLVLEKMGMSMSQEHHHHHVAFGQCGPHQIWDLTSNMCLSAADPDNPVWNVMLHGNIFLVSDWQTGPRKDDAIASPNMLMLDVGHTLAQNHYLSMEIMLTGEQWSYPKTGYPELLQIGERNRDGVAYLDAQHPHSSPVMGLTFKDTIRLAPQKFVKLFFAPRGESTDGPIAFMHRKTGEVNPDAPLGHHVGQDVGHVSSTVVGAALRSEGTEFEISGFHGLEPNPDQVDLPLGKLDSAAIRLSQVINPKWEAMASYAYVQNPELDETNSVRRYSASAYSQYMFGEWMCHNSLIAGVINDYDSTDRMLSFAEEFLFENSPYRIWGRIETLQRTARELQIENASEPDTPHWLTAWTIGYTRTIAQVGDTQLGAGLSLSESLLPDIFKAAYGGNPWTGRVFLHLNGMNMW